MKNAQEFRQQKGKKTWIWKIAQDGESYTTEHGLLDGAKQTFSDTPGPKGKVGTKAFVSAEDNATFNLKREIRKKIENGYIEYIDGQPVTKQITSIDFNEYLPKNFCPYKPMVTPDDNGATIKKIFKAGKARATRKRDGMNHILVHHTFGWEVYSRRIDLVTEKYPNHIAELQNSNLKPGTIIVGELLCEKADGTDDFRAISRVCRSDAEEARKLIDSGECPESIYCIFDFLWKDGVCLDNTTYDSRMVFWKDELDKWIPDHKLIRSVTYYDLKEDSWEKLAKDNKWEGFVLVDGSCKPGNKFFSYDGSAKRPKGHYKLKPVSEADICIFATTLGGGKRLDGVGAVHVKQIHPETGKYFYAGKVGSGFDDSSLEELEKMCADLKIPSLERDKDAEEMDLETGPGIVAQIEYSIRLPKSQKFRFGVFCRFRDDKKPEECIAEQLAEEE